jgi:hypothetical protein
MHPTGMWEVDDENAMEMAPCPKTTRLSSGMGSASVARVGSSGRRLTAGTDGQTNLVMHSPETRRASISLTRMRIFDQQRIVAHGVAFSLFVMAKAFRISISDQPFSEGESGVTFALVPWIA